MAREVPASSSGSEPQAPAMGGKVTQRIGSLLLVVLTAALAVDAPGVPRRSSSSDKALSTIQCSLAPGTCTNEAAVRLRVTTDLVQLSVTVVDKQDRIVENLQKENFSVYENGTEQNIVNFELDNGPVSACLVFDSSGSMTSKYHRSLEAIRELLDAAIPNDDYCLVRFSDSAEIMVGMTNDIARIAAAMKGIYPNGWTALLDGIYSGMKEVKRGNNRRKANTRRTQFVLECRLHFRRKNWKATLLKNISHQSGGRVYLIRQINELPNAVEKITRAVRQQYILGYYPTATSNGEYRHVTVKLRSPKGLRAYWRAGYFAPDQ